MNNIAFHGNKNHFVNIIQISYNKTEKEIAIYVMALEWTKHVLNFIGKNK
jgi:hypothetical protein